MNRIPGKDLFWQEERGKFFVIPDQKHFHMPRSAFLRLLYFKDKQCHICSQEVYLQVDHDKNNPPYFIRGLLCGSCNKAVGRYEHGSPIAEPLLTQIRAYLDNPPCVRLGMKYVYQHYCVGQNKGTA